MNDAKRMSAIAISVNLAYAVIVQTEENVHRFFTQKPSNLEPIKPESKEEPLQTKADFHVNGNR